MHVFKFKNKYSKTLLFSGFFDHSFSNFNFEQVFVSRVWKKSHNVLKTLFQGLFHSAICQNENLFKSLKQSNKLVGVLSAALIIELMTSA